ncbi:MAG TPA: hypothetical protein VK631_04125 [Solirubrobacteraceae bacterium]|nr:hypothetical protein [Solirubrobacteraceae bacterium]
MPTVIYDDPDFSKRYQLVTATGDTLVARREVTALAWNAEYAHPSAPLTKHLVTDPHIVSMADRFAKVTVP